MTLRPVEAAPTSAEMASFLDVYLAPLVEQLSQPDVTDIYINRVQEIWVERIDGSVKREESPALTSDLLWRLARQVASLSHQGISRAEPLLAAVLPNGARIQVIAPPATRDGMCIAIRKHVSADLALSDYANAGAFAETAKAEPDDPDQDLLVTHYDAGDWPAFLQAAVQARRTIVISGGTSTGKTTFLNALIREIPVGERLIFIEDTPEVTLRHPNAVGLVAVRGDMGETKVTAEDLLVASLRLRPDRIILGELRSKEALTFLRAANTGHPGSLTTIHANSPDQAREQLVLLISQASSMRRGDILAHIDATVDIFVQLTKRGPHRSISAVRWNRER